MAGAPTTEPAAAGAATAPPAVELEGLVRRYGERLALAGVGLELPAGATLAVLGPNGAGKTTLLRVLATLLRPHEGRVRVLGRALPDEGWAVRGRLGLIAHEPLLYRDLTARENLRYHARLHGVGAERVEELLAAVAMERRSDEPLRTLSRGMVQRLAVCRAVLHDPELLLLDEPVSHLDPAAAELVEPLLAGRSRVVASHDVDAALESADLVLGLRAGRQAFAAPANAVARAEIRALYAS